MNIPSVGELPFYDKEKHDVLTEQEKRERADAYREYRENLRGGDNPDNYTLGRDSVSAMTPDQ